MQNSGLDSRQRHEFFYPIQNVQPVISADPACVLTVPGALPQVVKRSGREVQCVPPSSAEVIKRSQTCASPLCLDGVDRGSFAFYVVHNLHIKMLYVPNLKHWKALV